MIEAYLEIFPNQYSWVVSGALKRYGLRRVELPGVLGELLGNRIVFSYGVACDVHVKGPLIATCQLYLRILFAGS